MGKIRKRSVGAFRLFRRILREGLFVVSLIFFGGTAGFFLIYAFRVPNPLDLLERRMAKTSILYDRSGDHVLYEIHGDEDRKTLSHEEIPDIVRFATIAAEDDGFFHHLGFDVPSLFRAVVKNMRSGGAIQGGSTITQQVARIFYLDQRKTIARKLNELALAIKIERRYSKDEILDLYLNAIPYGSNVYGIESAAETFFGKRAVELSLDEAAFLSAIPKATTYYSPYTGQKKALRVRQESIIRRMGSLGLVTKDAVKQALAVETIGKIRPKRDAIIAPHFVFYAMEELDRRYGREALLAGGLRVRTTLDLDMQRIAEEAVARGSKRNAPFDAENASLVAIDPKSGGVLSMVGSRDYFDESIDGAVNVSTRKRQPGSVFKPIVYARAFEDGFNPETFVLDAPLNFGQDGTKKMYTPSNYTGRFYGVRTLRQALSMSLNVSSVEVLNVVGVEHALATAKSLGISTLDDPRGYGLSLVLGGAEVRLIDMVGAYSVFASEGIRREASPIVSVERDGKMQYELLGGTLSERVLDEEVCRKINSVLSDNLARADVFGSRSALSFPERMVAVKTGTTQRFRDAWTIGYTPSIVVGVWVGNNDNRPMKEGSDGSKIAAPIWRDFMDQALPRYAQENFGTYIRSGLRETRLIAGGRLTMYDPDK